jgi:hypothetical protein
METGRKRIRRDFAPLTVSVAISCESAYSPSTQVYNASTQEYEPDRSVSPTVIRPIINAHAADGSWPNPVANSSLANMKWYVNDTDITTLESWQNQYTVEATGSTRGSLTVLKNISPLERASLHFEADLVDTRLGVTIHIKTDPIILSTVDKSEDSYGISIGENNLRYSPFDDKLHLYDYKVAHGIIAADASVEAAARDGNEYQRTIPIQVYLAGALIDSGYTIKLYKIGANMALTEVSASDYEVLSVSATGIQLDLRLIDKADYMVKAFVNNAEVAKNQISVERIYRNFTCTPTNETGIHPGQTARYDEAMVNCDGKVIPYPGNVLKIIWHTDTAYIINKIHNEGGTTIFQLADTGIGNTDADDWVDVYVEAVQKEKHSVAIDENDDILTDESGNILIFN